MTRHDSADDAEDALDPVLQDAVHALREPVHARREARAALASALTSATPEPRQEPRRTPLRPARWFTTPRPIRMSPVGMLAAATLLVVCGALLPSRLRVARSDSNAAARSTAPGTNGGQVVRFSLVAPDARRVSLVGDFNGWDPAATALQQRDGTWTVVIPVTPGRHQYGFVVDGSTWIADPAAARSADSDFGTPNSVVYVGT